MNVFRFGNIFNKGRFWNGSHGKMMICLLLASILYPVNLRLENGDEVLLKQKIS